MSSGPPGAGGHYRRRARAPAGERSSGGSAVLDNFRAWDSNKDGGISLQELQTALTTLGLEAATIPSLFKAADANKDGQIDYAEFVAWLFACAPPAVRRVATKPLEVAAPAVTPAAKDVIPPDTSMDVSASATKPAAAEDSAQASAPRTVEVSIAEAPAAEVVAEVVLTPLKGIDVAAAAAAAEISEIERVCLPLSMEAYSKKVVISDAHYNLYRQDFDTADTNSDGKIEKGEVATLLSLQMGKEATDEQTNEFLEKFDTNKDGFITLVEWIGGVIGKEFSVSSMVASDIDCEESKTERFLDKDGNPLCVGLIYQFIGGGCSSGDVCQFKGTSGNRAMLAGKSTHFVDGIGQYNGMNIVTSNTKNLKRATEKEAYIKGQSSTTGMLKFYRKKVAEGNTEYAERIETTIKVIEGYSKFTGISPQLDSPAAAPLVSSSGPFGSIAAAEARVRQRKKEAYEAAAEARERERVALPMQMEAYSKKIVLSEEQFSIYKRDFDAVDKDGSGKVDKAEVTALLAATLGQHPRPDQVDSFLEKFDRNADGLITLEEWISAVIGATFENGKDWCVSNHVLEEGADVEGAPILDADGEPMTMGLIYTFTGGGCCGGDVCQFQGTSKGSRQVRMAGKNVFSVDGIGAFSGMTIVTTNTAKLRRSTEKASWVAAQKSCMRMLDHFKKKAADGEEDAAESIDKVKAVIRGYAEFTQLNPLEA